MLHRFTVDRRFVRRLVIVLSLIILSGGLTYAYLTFIRPQKTEAAWFDDSWKYRVKINIASHTSAENNVYVTVPSFDATDTNKFQSDCGDLRFTKEDGELLKYFVNDCDATSTVRVLWNTLPAGESNYYMYYGNPSASNGFSLTDFTAGANNLGSQTSGSETPGPGPISYWRFDQGTDNTCPGGVNDACDTMASRNDLARTNATWRAEDSCVSDKCFEFDGSGDYLSLANDNDFDFGTGSFSISLWFRHSGIDTNPDYMIARHHTTGTDGGFKVYMNASGTVSFGIDDDSTSFPSDVASSTSIYDDNNWHHLEAVKNGTTSILLYIDGKQVGTDSPITTSSISNDDTLYIGIDGDGSSNSWDGLIDNVKVYGYARTAAEVRADATLNSTARGVGIVLGNRSTEFLTDGLVGYWKMDETSWTLDCATDSAFDSSGNGNNGDSCLSTTGPAGGAAGKFNYAGDFDGTNDRLNMGDPSSGVLDFGNGDFTISLWFKPDTTQFAKRLVAKGAFSSSVGYYIGMNDDVGNALQLFVSAASTPDWINPVTTNVFTDTSRWYQAIAVVDRGNSVRIYVDGILQNIDKVAGTCGTDMGTYLDISMCTSANASTTDDFTIGCERTSSTQCFNGKIDEVRMYSRAFSDIEARGLSDYTPGPVGWWKMDDGTGLTAFDSSGNSRNGTLRGQAKWGPGKFGGAAQFDGSKTAPGSSITIADDTFDSLTQATLSLWFKQNNRAGQDDWEDLIAAAGTPSNVFELALQKSDSTIQIYTNGCPTEIRGEAVVPGNPFDWHHLVYTVDPVVPIHKLYIDGSQQTVSYTSGSAANVCFFNTISSGTTRYRLGCYEDSTNGGACYDAEMYEGLLDDVRIYDYPRTQSQILEDMNANSTSAPPSPPLISWTFDDGQGITAKNRGTANASDGTLTSITTPATATSGWTPNGKLNKAIVFDGTDDKVVIATADDAAVDFNGAEPFTLSAWVYSTSVPANASEQDFIMGKWDQTTSLRAYRIVLENDDTDTTGNFRAEVYDDVGANQSVGAESPADSVSANTWYHVVMTFTGCITSCDGTVLLYVNGIDVGIPDSTGSFAGIDDVGSDFTVGDYDATDNNANRTGFTGYIDEVKVYSGILTRDNIRVNMDAGALRVGFSQSSADESSQVGDGIGNPPLEVYTFDENTGTSAKDTSGNDKTGTLNFFEPASAWKPGKYGSSLQFDDASTYVSVPTPLLPTANMTLEAWINLKTRSDETIFSIGGSNELFFRIVGSGSIELSLNNINAFEGNEIVPLNTWTHVAVTRSGTALAGYINGVPDPAPVTSSSSETPSFSTCYLLIGTDADSATSNCTTSLGNYMNGRIDDVKIFDYARTQNQIAYDYNRGRPIGWWKLDECQGQTAYDSGGNAANGTINIGATGGEDTIGTCTTSSTAWGNGATGKYNSALDFDGTDDWIDMNDIANLDFVNSQNFSVAGWFNRDTFTADHTIVAKKNDQANSTAGYIIWIDDTTDDLRLVVSDGDSANLHTVDSTSSFTATGWHHFAVVYDDSGSSASKIYIDGKDDSATNTTSGTFANIASLANSTDFRIGSDSDASGGAGNAFDGKLDEIRVYNYALSASQVRKIYTNDSSVFFGPNTGSP